MGRKKIQIKAIVNEKTRLVTFAKRKNGLFKKAYELSVLCDCEIALIVFTRSNRLYQYASSSVDQVINRRSAHITANEFYTNHDIEKFVTHQHASNKKEPPLVGGLVGTAIKCDLDDDQAMATDVEDMNDEFARSDAEASYHIPCSSTTTPTNNSAPVDDIENASLFPSESGGPATKSSPDTIAVAMSYPPAVKHSPEHERACSSAFTSTSGTITNYPPRELAPRGTTPNENLDGNLSLAFQESAQGRSLLPPSQLTDPRVAGRSSAPVGHPTPHDGDSQAIATLLEFGNSRCYTSPCAHQSLQNRYRSQPGLSPVGIPTSTYTPVSSHCTTHDESSIDIKEEPMVTQPSRYDAISDNEDINNTGTFSSASVISDSTKHSPTVTAASTPPSGLSDGGLHAFTPVCRSRVGGVPTTLGHDLLPRPTADGDLSMPATAAAAALSFDFPNSEEAPSPGQPGAFVRVSGGSTSRLSRLKLLRGVPRLSLVQRERQPQSLVTPGTFLPTPDVETIIEKLEVEQGRSAQLLSSAGCQMNSHRAFCYPLDLSTLTFASPAAVDADNQSYQNFLYPISLERDCSAGGDPVTSYQAAVPSSSPMSVLSLESLSALGVQANRELMAMVPPMTGSFGHYIQARHSNGGLQ